MCNDHLLPPTKSAMTNPCAPLTRAFPTLLLSRAFPILLLCLALTGAADPAAASPVVVVGWGNGDSGQAVPSEAINRERFVGLDPS